MLLSKEKKDALKLFAKVMDEIDESTSSEEICIMLSYALMRFTSRICNKSLLKFEVAEADGTVLVITKSQLDSPEEKELKYLLKKIEEENLESKDSLH